MSADVFRLPRAVPTAPRTVQDIDAAMRFHTEALKALALEFAMAHSKNPAAQQLAQEPDQVLSLQRAAHEIGWTPQRLLRHIVRHNRDNPHDPLAFQPGSMANTAWCVPMRRLRRYVRGQRAS